MHGLDIIIARNLKADGRAAGHVEADEPGSEQALRIIGYAWIDADALGIAQDIHERLVVDEFFRAEREES